MRWQSDDAFGVSAPQRSVRKRRCLARTAVQTSAGQGASGKVLRRGSAGASKRARRA
jgi:hypothetical protein